MKSTKHVGIWIRVSTDFQVKDESPEHHEKRARMYAEAKGWEVMEVYRMDAVSGKSVMELAETKRMLRDIKTGHISALIFSKLARLARNTRELLDFSEIFRQCNADLISLAESIDTSTPAGRLFYTMLAAMAEWERAEIAERVAASVPVRAKLGKPLGGQASFGYRWEGHELVIDEKEAPIRKLLYDLFSKYQRRKRTSTELNTLGYRTRNGSKFSDTTVQRLLRDPTAKGIRLANYTKSLGEGKKWILKPKEDWITIPCPAVVSEELWNRCNEILDEQERKRKPKGRRSIFLLAGFITCHCGRKMYVYHVAPVYYCKGCKNKIAVDDIDQIFMMKLKTFLMETNLTDYLEESDHEVKEKERLLKLAKAERLKLSNKMDELVNMRLTQELSRDAFTQHYRPLEEQLKQIEDNVPKLEAEIDFRKVNLISSDTIMEQAKKLFEDWSDFPFEEKRAIVETITEKIVIGKNDITISLSYIPETPSYLNSGTSSRNLRDS